MRNETLARRHELFVATATLASHASAQGRGFRQRDVRFFTELFSNWAHPDTSSELVIQNVQIQRYLHYLGKEGFLKNLNKGSRPLFKLTRIGLLELLTRLVESKREREPAEFLFLVYFVSGYREWLFRLIKDEGAQFPPSMQIELDALLDTATLVQRELNRVDKQITKLKMRIDDAHRTSTLVSEKIRRGEAFDQIVREVERKIPYELNSRRPLSELISSIQPDQRLWELRDGNRLRAKIIWEPAVKLLDEYRRLLSELGREIKPLK
jgi:hypothetical protein